MYLNSNKKITLLCYVALFLAGGALHYIDIRSSSLPFRAEAVSFLVYCGIYVVFIILADKNLTYRATRHYYILIAMYFLFWKIDEMMMLNLFPINSDPARQLWYLQGIPTHFIPNFTLLAVLGAGRRYKETFDKKWYGTLFVSGALSALYITNDIHQFVFRYPEGGPLHITEQTYGPGYFISTAWTFLMFGMAVFFILKMLRVKELRKYAVVIYLALAAGVAYMFWYVSGDHDTFNYNAVFGDIEVWVAILLTSLEGIVRLGLIRSNFNYTELFEAATISAQLQDSDGIRYQTANLIPTTKEQQDTAMRGGEVYLDDDHRLHGRMLSGGRMFWVEDVGVINRTTRELNETRKQLEQENDLIKAENEMIVRFTRAEEQNRLYDLLAKRVKPQLEKIESILDDTSPDDPEIKDKIARACVYKVFVKRLANMELLALENNILNLFELASAMHETEEYLRLNRGVEASAVVTGSGSFRADALMMIYSIAEEALESAIDDLVSMDVRVNGEDGMLDMAMYVSAPGIEKKDVVSKETLMKFRARGADLSIRRGRGAVEIRINDFIGWG